MEEKILDTLLQNVERMAEIKNYQERHLKEFDNLRDKVEKQGETLSAVEASLKGLAEVLENERKLNRDRQIDAAKVLEDKMDTLYKGVSILTTVISLTISVLHNFFK